MNHRMVRFGLIALALCALLAALGPQISLAAPNVSSGVVISQVYGGGGNTAATFKNDFVELFNRGTSTVSLAGYSIQYTSSTGTGKFSANIVSLSGSVAAGQYFLVALASSGIPGIPLPTPDLTNTGVNMGGTGGKVVLANSTTGLDCNGSSSICTATDLAKIIDLVGYGTANYYEGSGPAPAPSNTTAALRNNGGCTDTDNNSADFTVLTPAPRNTTTAFNACSSGTPTNPSGTGAANPGAVLPGDTTLLTVAVTPGTNPASTGLAVSADLTSIGGSPAQTLYDDGTNGDIAANNNVFSFQATVTGGTAVGVKTLPFTISDGQSRAGAGSISLNVYAITTRIHDIQGAAHISPLNGQTVSNVPGIVTAKRSQGFYMQDPNPDANPATSEGIYVYTVSAPSVNVGDSVLVSGMVDEYRSGTAPSPNLTLTEIKAPTVFVLASGVELPAAIVIGTGGLVPPSTVIEDDASNVETTGVFDPGTDGIDFYEALEGMLVQVNNAVAVGPNNTGYGELPVVGDNGANAGLRTARGGIYVRPNDFNPERIILDDEVAKPMPNANVGDHLTPVIVGVLDYSFGNYKLEVKTAPTIISGALALESASAPATGQLAIGAFNVQNLAPSDPASKFSSLADLIVNHLKSPDLVSVEEIQDNTGATDNGVVAADQTWTALINAITAAGGPSYSYTQIDPVNDQDGGAPGGNIRQGFLYRTDRGLAFVSRPGAGSTTANSVVSASGNAQLQYSPGRIDPTNSAFDSSRKPLAAEFTFNGRTIIAIANHWNSKGGDDPLFGFRQSPVLSSETQRMGQATILKEFVQSILAVNSNSLVVVMGDLNDFTFSNPLLTLKSAPLHDLIEDLPENEQYTYVYDGNSQVLDHILVSSGFTRTATILEDIVHVNSEFAVRASDHEPQVALITFNAPTAVTVSGLNAHTAANLPVALGLLALGMGVLAALGFAFRRRA